MARRRTRQTARRPGCWRAFIAGLTLRRTLPLLHAALLARPGEPRAVLNLGGIANLTLLDGAGGVRGFDTGPANALLDAWCARHTGTAHDAGGALAAAGRADHPLLRRVGESIRVLGLPLEPFDDLIEANRQDQVVDRYEGFDDLKAYCMLSAAPVGRLVLAVWGCATPERIALSDDVCIGLQLAEHIQDVGEDARRGRTYLPMAHLREVGCDRADLLAPSAGGPLRRILAGEVVRARRFLSSGPALAATLPWRERLALAGFVGGGMAALDAVVRADFDVLGRSCRPSPSGVVRRALEVLSAAGSGRRRATGVRTASR
jgi:phytoene/squalene synthetase